MKLSVLMAVYAKESPAFLQTCLESLAWQTMPADEIVLVEDGPIAPALRDVIDSFRPSLPIVSVPLASNGGLGAALRVGLAHCSGDIVARMDSDDISLPDRFAVQFAFLAGHPEIDVVGAAIAEFHEDWTRPHSIRALPLRAPELTRFARHRNPLNHVTVVFRKASVLAAGGYQPRSAFEDYHLWARMLLRGACFANLPQALVHVRCGNGMQRRRGGPSYALSEARAQGEMHRMGFLSTAEWARNMLVRGPVRLVPASLRGLIYSAWLRSPVDPSLPVSSSSFAGDNRV
jgi:glycosyltransferase involved in cell wall biosynthesis